MVPLEMPALAAMSWSRALASPHSPKTSRAALMICTGRSAGHLRHFGGAALVLGIVLLIVSDRSVTYDGPGAASTGRIRSTYFWGRPLGLAIVSKGFRGNYRGR